MTNTNTTTGYFVVAAPGYYGDATRVASSHRTVAAAMRAARAYGNAVVRLGALTRGARFLRSDEAVYAVVGGAR